MGDIITEYESAYNINIRCLINCNGQLPAAGVKPTRMIRIVLNVLEPAHKRVIIFSPHPDDDVISMGGTFIRLHDQGHEVHVAYQTSGKYCRILRWRGFDLPISWMITMKRLDLARITNTDRQSSHAKSGTKVQVVKSILAEISGH